MKVCNKCNRLLDETMFHKNARSKDGLTNYCKDCKKTYDENYRSIAENKERQKKYNREYFSKPENKQKKREYVNQPEIYKAKKIRDNLYHNQPEIKEKYNTVSKMKYANDIYYHLNKLTLCLLSDLLSGRTKDSQVIIERCGYTAQQLRNHIESLFDENMNWSNYGEYWELDHIKPRNRFYYESYNDEQFKQCWALDNLRPLEIIANRSREKV